MKIVDRKTFLSLPPGTIYCDYEPYIFRMWARKGETIWHDWPHDFFLSDLVSVHCQGSDDLMDKLDDAQINGTSLELCEDSYSRDGCFNGDQLYAILEPDDIKCVISLLSNAPTTS